MTAAKKEGIRSELLSIKDISPGELIEMHALFVQYYDNVPLETFIRDLNKKKAVIMVRGKKSRKVCGFSTITEVDLQYKGKKALGVFSGDTVMKMEYWGVNTLHIPFFTYMVKLRLSRPFTPIFWLLISKGYKTYLLLANNFDNYYPRYDRPVQPDYEAMVETYCETLWPGKYDRKSKVLDFGKNTQRLKDHVTPITDKLRKEVPKIAFFEQCNPRWNEGIELPCLGEATYGNAFTYAQKYAQKILGVDKKTRKTMPHTAAQPGG